MAALRGSIVATLAFFAMSIGSNVAAATETVSHPMSQSALNAFDSACAAGALIKGRQDLDIYISGDGARAGSPLAALSDAGRRRFLASVRFHGHIVVGFSTADLEAELTMSQAYELLALFGMQSQIVNMPDALIKDDNDRAIDAWRIILRDSQ